MKYYRIVADAPPNYFRIGDIYEWNGETMIPKGKYLITEIEYLGVNSQGFKIDKHTLEPV